MTTLNLRKSIGRQPLGHGFLLITLALALFALSPAPKAFGVTPAPDGGYPNDNTAEGSGALQSLTTGAFNTANGFDALFHNTTGSSNTANGEYALFRNATGSSNTANGVGALEFNTTGNDNTASGLGALNSNTTGGFNTANGVDALFNNTTGHDNTANGFEALLHNTTGNFNTANGSFALGSNTSGLGNTADGAGALLHNTTGRLNIVLGAAAGQNLTTGSNNIDISNPGVAAESNIIRVGNEVAFTDVLGIVHPAHTKTFIAGIHGATASGAVTVYVNSSGQLGTLPSSARFKDDIQSMDKASEVILALKPVTFHYKAEIDPKGIPQFGLVAEEVEKVNPDLVARDDQGKVYTVRYEAVNAMLLNEFLKEHRTVDAQERKVQEQETLIARLKSTAAKQEATITQVKSTAAKQEATIAKQQKQIEALTTGLQKVSAQVEMSRPAPQMVDNHQ